MSTYMLFNMPPWSGWQFLHDTEYEISKIEFVYQKKHLQSIKELSYCIKIEKFLCDRYFYRIRAVDQPAAWNFY